MRQYQQKHEVFQPSTSSSTEWTYGNLHKCCTEMSFLAFVWLPLPIQSAELLLLIYTGGQPVYINHRLTQICLPHLTIIGLMCISWDIQEVSICFWIRLVPRLENNSSFLAAIFTSYQPNPCSFIEPNISAAPVRGQKQTRSRRATYYYAVILVLSKFTKGLGEDCLALGGLFFLLKSGLLPQCIEHIWTVACCKTALLWLDLQDCSLYIILTSFTCPPP